MHNELTPNRKAEREALNQILEILEGFDQDAMKRVLTTVLAFSEFVEQPMSTTGAWAQHTQVSAPQNMEAPDGPVPYSDKQEVTPKEFLREKDPQTDVQRMACLAYYLTHYRDQSFFKTVDLSKVNTEAAQPKFSNASKTAANAMQYRYFVPGQKPGTRQLSAAGEDYVAALPDKSAAKAAMARSRPRTKRRSVKVSTAGANRSAKSGDE